MANLKSLASLGEDMDDVAIRANEKGKAATEILLKTESSSKGETEITRPSEKTVSLDKSQDEILSKKPRNDDKRRDRKRRKKTKVPPPRTEQRFITVLNNQNPTVPFSSKLTLSSKIKLKEQSLKRQLKGLDYPTQTAILEEALFLFYEKHLTVD